MNHTLSRRLVLTGAIATLIAGCATVPARTDGAGPVVLERDFRGRSYASGVFVNSITGARRAFDVVLDGRWDGRVLTLREAFAYEDGERDVKTWRFTKTGDGIYDGVREDVVGTARVYTEAGVIRLSYDVDLGTGANRTRVHFEDVIERRGDGVIVNRAIVSKFGVPVGTVDLSFSRRRPR